MRKIETKTLPCRTRWTCSLLLALLTGCASVHDPSAERRARPADVARAEMLYLQKNYTEALKACIDVAHRDPTAPGLAELRTKIMTALAELRGKTAALRAEVSATRALIDVDDDQSIPETYNLRRFVQGEEDPQHTPPSSAERTLKRPVTLHLDRVNLDTFILALGASENINIIADSTDNTKTMTVHADAVPLGEILDYVARNLGIAFYLGENIIWATAQTGEPPTVPLETRMYRLRKGVPTDAGTDGTQQLPLLDAITRFVPDTPGADILFDKKSHLLIARNTRANLAAIEQLIAGMDVCPPQVLIEARFVSTSVTDLRELGIDWILNSPITLTTDTTVQQGTAVETAHAQISDGEVVRFTPFENASHGLNLTYQGLLTEPAFQAVLHALQISGQAQTLSAPKITTVNNRPASIRVGEDFRYFEEFDTTSVPTVTDEGATVYTSMLVPVGKPQLEELGIELAVTPSVGADLRMIELSLVPEISEFVRFESYEVGLLGGDSQDTTTNGLSVVKLPIFRRSRIETEVVVQSGETVVMGGLVTSTGDTTVRKVPFLGSIPLIGKFFQHDTRQEAKQNLLIFVTATLISERGEDLIPTHRVPLSEQAAGAVVTGQDAPAEE